MKSLLLSAALCASFLIANPKKESTPDEHIEIARQIACEIAYKHFFRTASEILNSEKKLFVPQELPVYEAFAFIEEHCRNYKPTFLEEEKKLKQGPQSAVGAFPPV